jgi:hypothetical protein
MKRVALSLAAIGLSGALYLAFTGTFAGPKGGSTTTTAPPTTRAVTGPQAAGPAPVAPPVRWCESGFTNPYQTAPPGAVTIPAGDDSHTAIVANYTMKPNTVYWFAPGVHTLGPGQYAQIQAAPGDTFIGAPGAVLDGQRNNDYAFATNSDYGITADTGVTIEYLTIENFAAGQGEAVVGQGGYDGWIVKYNLIKDNPKGAGVALGTNSTVTDNCLTNNGQYGFNSFQSRHVTFTHNEVSFNDSAGEYDHPGGANPDCGCAGGGKFWQTIDATVAGNYVHDNGDPGLWADTDNAGFDISDNFIANNYGEGIMYEISYNARIADNTLIGNDVGAGAHNETPEFPGSAIYISESGSDPQVPTRYNQQFLISGNVLTDNWGGVTLYDSAYRACGISNDAVCTLVNPGVFTVASCGKNLPTARADTSPDYFHNCRWKTQNVTVRNNTFKFDPAHLGGACAAAAAHPKAFTGCGFNALFATYGMVAPYKAWVVPHDMSTQQNDHFEDNTYIGPWKFVGFAQDGFLSWPDWTAGTSNNDGSGQSFPHQDAGSTLRS